MPTGYFYDTVRLQKTVSGHENPIHATRLLRRNMERGVVRTDRRCGEQLVARPIREPWTATHVEMHRPLMGEREGPGQLFGPGEAMTTTSSQFHGLAQPNDNVVRLLNIPLLTSNYCGLIIMQLKEEETSARNSMSSAPSPPWSSRHWPWTSYWTSLSESGLSATEAQAWEEPNLPW
jgi:hypothetical protein